MDGSDAMILLPSIAAAFERAMEAFVLFFQAVSSISRSLSTFSRSPSMSLVASLVLLMASRSLPICICLNNEICGVRCFCIRSMQSTVEARNTPVTLMRKESMMWHRRRILS